jgi:hypothetical protein
MGTPAIPVAGRRELPQLGIAYRLADGLFDRALYLFRRSLDPILIHD